MVELKNTAGLNETELKNVTQQYNAFIEGYIRPDEILSAEIVKTIEMGNDRYAKVVTTATIPQAKTFPTYSDFFKL